ncbi:MAG: aromatic ring-hydroxylating dioxygenase subunit alpha [Alphaproteobacteria bacterium]
MACLPAWTYGDPAFFALERERVFMPSWQLVCHVNDIARPGDYCSLDILGEPLVAVRGRDGRVRAFHNVCRHRGARLVAGPKGSCGRRLTCPYHGWSYALDGRLVGVPFRRDYDGLNADALGLAPVELETFLGFVFARVESGGPTVAEMMAPYADELGAYRIAEMMPLGRVTLRRRPVNWKTVADNYADTLHIPVAHPGLSRLFGGSYRIESRGWVDRMSGTLVDTPSANPSERAYQAVLPAAAHLPPERRRQWCYYRLWPNLAFDVYPDQLDFMQFIPLSPTETLIREIPYGLPDERREMRAARYLNWRINRQVNREDSDLIEAVQAGMGSHGHCAGPLSRREVGLGAFADRMRAALPECRGTTRPVNR